MKHKNLINKILTLCIASALTMSAFAATASAAEGDMKISLGADLNESQEAEVFRLLDIDSVDPSNVIYVTNEEEHQYLDQYVSADKIGTEALSSSKIILKGEGYGIKVTTYNINYCTVGMYQSALATAGVKNADVYVAGPDKISGTAALVGVMKAYSTASDGTLNEENVEAATQELAVTSSLGESINDPEKAEQIIAELKKELSSIDGMDDATLDQNIRDIANELGVSLTDEQVASIRELLRKLGSLDIDWDSVWSQLKGLYEKYTGSGADLGNVQNIFNKIGNFFSGIFDKISSFFSEILG